MNERLKTHSKTQKKSADLVSNKLRIGVFQQYQMKCKSVSKKSPRYKTQHLTVMLLDIDYFKSINDNYGHECGDKVLSVFARHIQKIVGDKGLVARMGGEEFAVAVPSVNPVDGLLMAEKIRKGVELQPFTWQQKTLYLTVSIGVGSGRASYRTLTDDFNKLMVEADTCLYRSKKDGRNRTSTMRYGEEVV